MTVRNVRFNIRHPVTVSLRQEKRMKNRKQTFTLIEAIFIFSICLFFILLFILPLRARRDARKISCSNNLKQIGLSMRMYAGVYSEAYPDKNGRAGLQQLAEWGFLEATQVYVCPNTDDIVETPLDIYKDASYAWKDEMGEWNHFLPASLMAVSSDREKNHYLFGNILYVDGHVTGYSGCNWTVHLEGAELGDFYYGEDDE